MVVGLWDAATRTRTPWSRGSAACGRGLPSGVLQVDPRSPVNSIMLAFPAMVPRFMGAEMMRVKLPCRTGTAGDSRAFVVDGSTALRAGHSRVAFLKDGAAPRP